MPRVQLNIQGHAKAESVYDHLLGLGHEVQIGGWSGSWVRVTVTTQYPSGWQEYIAEHFPDLTFTSAVLPSCP